MWYILLPLVLLLAVMWAIERDKRIMATLERDIDEMLINEIKKAFCKQETRDNGLIEIKISIDGKTYSYRFNPLTCHIYDTETEIKDFVWNITLQEVGRYYKKNKK